MDSNNTRWNSIDAAKGCACIGVVFIHVLFPEPLAMTVKSMMRFAVPVFLMVSGFFFTNGSNLSDALINRKLRHIVVLTVKAGCFYLLFSIFWFNFSFPEWSAYDYIKANVTAGRIVKLFITNDPFIYLHLWFLLALIYIYVFCLLFFTNENRIKAVPYLCTVLMIGYSALQEFGEIIGIKSAYTIPGSDQYICLFNLFFFRALPFFLLGIWLRNSSEKIKKIPLWTLFLMIITGTLLSAVEYRFTRDTQFFLGNIVASTGIMILAIKNPERGGTILPYIGRRLSVYVYIIHIAVFRVLSLLLDKNSIAIQWSMPVFVLFITLLFAYWIDIVKRRVRGVDISNRKM